MLPLIRQCPGPGHPDRQGHRRFFCSRSTYGLGCNDPLSFDSVNRIHIYRIPVCIRRLAAEIETIVNFRRGQRPPGRCPARVRPCGGRLVLVLPLIRKRAGSGRDNLHRRRGSFSSCFRLQCNPHLVRRVYVNNVCVDRFTGSIRHFTPEFKTVERTEYGYIQIGGLS